MRVLVCGGRHYEDARHVSGVLDALKPKPTLIIEGGARGADALAKDWAKNRGVRCATFEADWSKHGRAAGPMRNAEMLRVGEPDVVVAFPGGRGTADMVRRAEAAGIKLVVFE